MVIYSLIVRLRHTRKCKKGYIWLTDGDFISPSKFKRSGSAAYGYALNNHTVVRIKRSKLAHTWIEAKSYCEECKNACRYGYLPNVRELYLLYSSIMSGKMKDGLTTAGLYEECNYRSASGKSSEPNWCCVWSDNEYDFTNSYLVNFMGNANYFYKYESSAHVIPFFKIPML